MPESHEELVARFEKAVPILEREGFSPVGLWQFKRDGKLYDFRTADLDEIKDRCDPDDFRVDLREVAYGDTPDSSDLRKLIDLLDGFRVGYRVLKKAYGSQRGYTVRCDQGMHKVEGSSGFGTFYQFDLEGHFVKMGAWE